MSKNIKLALLGYGSMGREIEAIAHNFGFVVSEIFDIDRKIERNGKYEFDVAIDFSASNAVKENAEIIASIGKNLVIGTTGLAEELEQLKEIAVLNNTGIIYASNFSVGMQIFRLLVENMAKLVEKSSSYDIFMHEIHHKRKKDSPSGTALSLAEIILSNSTTKKTIKTDKSEGTISPDELHVSSVRGGEVFGTHTVYSDSFSDTIELTHRAKNRRGFAEGALRAAEWIYGKKGFYKFDDVFESIFGAE